MQQAQESETGLSVAYSLPVEWQGGLELGSAALATCERAFVMSGSAAPWHPHDKRLSGSIHVGPHAHSEILWC